MSATKPKAALLAIGDELLAGAHPDLNSPAIAAALDSMNWEVLEVAVLGDDEQRIAQRMRALAQGRDLVVVTGGLGPTLDDVTRHAAARAAGLELVHSEEAWDQVRTWFENNQRPMPDSNRRQALIPVGAEVVPNPVGTAPGFRVPVADAMLWVLPGPPSEMRVMLEGQLLPWLRAHPLGGSEPLCHSFYLTNLSESLFAERAGDWMDREAEPRMGVTVKSGVLSVRLMLQGAAGVDGAARLEQRCRAFRERFAEAIFSESSADLAGVLGQRLIEQGISVTTAESCTGGLVAARLTGVPGISAVLAEAVVVYADEAKSARLGVPTELLERCGAVSREVVEAMARGAAERCGARLSIAISGVAGPTGGSPEKPVGLVHFATCMDGHVVHHERRWAAAGRDKIREWATTAALALLLSALD